MKNTHILASAASVCLVVACSASVTRGPRALPQGALPGNLDGFGADPGDVLKLGYIPQLFGSTRVTYTENAGMAVVQGDILVRPSETPPAPSVVAIRGDNLWPRAVIPYEIVSDFLNSTNLQTAMVEWETKTPIRFVKRTSHHKDYVRFENNMRDDAGRSYVGRVGGGQPIYIGKNLDAGGIVHEIGHAIGLAHEHTSVERDRFIQVFLSNVEDGQGYNFEEATDFLVLRPYDYSSIMHYGPKAFGKKVMGNRLTTIARKDGVPVLGRGQTLTVDDVRGVEALYGPFAFVSGFGGGWAPGGKSCFLMGPSKDTRFQSKTGITLFCVASRSWFWSNLGLSDPRIAGLSNYQCNEIYAPLDAEFSAEKNYVCYPAATPIILRWSDAGPLPNLKCVQPYIRGAGAAWSSANLCYQSATVGVLGELPRSSSDGSCLSVDASNQVVTGPRCEQRWQMTTVAAGGTTLLSLEPADYLQPRIGAGACLGTADDVPKPGDRVLAQPCDPLKRSQHWTLGAAGQLHNGGPAGLCLRSTVGSGVVTVATCTASAEVQWVIRGFIPQVPRCDGLTHEEACGSPPVCGTVVDRCGTEFPCGPPCPEPPPDPCPPEGCPPPPPRCSPPSMTCCDGTCDRVCGVCSN
ncbi:M12 family metallopeptidase [Sorangium sp. So ce134]